MGIFAQGSKSSKNGSGGRGTIGTVVGSGSKIDGTVSCDGSLRIDGNVDGSVVATESVVIGDTGHIEGDVTASEIVIAGELRGNAIASHLVELLPTGKLHGDARAPRISMSEEAFVCGRCVTSEGDASAVVEDQDPVDGDGIAVENEQTLT